MNKTSLVAATLLFSAVAWAQVPVNPPSGGGVATSIAVGATLTGGTDKRMVYDNNGVIGETSGVTFPATGILAATTAFRGPAGTSSVPSFSFTANVGDGFYQDDNNHISVTLATFDRFRFQNDNTLAARSNGAFAWQDGGLAPGNVNDTSLSRISAGLVSIGNGTVGDFSGALKSATATFTTLATDAGHTDNTVCADSSTGLLYKGSGTIGICLGTSSARYKHDIAPLVMGLNEVTQLQAITYYYNKGYGNDGAKKLYGFTAEQVYEVMPELVSLDAEGHPNAVDWAGMVPVLVRSIQELKVEVDRLKSK